MFITVTVNKIKTVKEVNEKEPGTDYDGQEVRIRASSIDKYYDVGDGSVLDMANQSRWYVAETVQQLDAMLGTVNPTAAKILFGRKE